MWVEECSALIFWFNLQNKPSGFIFPILQVGKLRAEVIKAVCPNHEARTYLNPVLSVPKSWGLNHCAILALIYYSFTNAYVYTLAFLSLILWVAAKTSHMRQCDGGRMGTLGAHDRGT